MSPSLGETVRNMEDEGLYGALSTKLAMVGVLLIKLSAAVDAAEVSCDQVRGASMEAFEELMSAIADIEKADLE